MNTTISTSPAVSAAKAPARRVKDAPTRAAHWWMAASFLVAYITGDSESWRLWHVIAGYSMLLALGFRLLWAVVGPQPVRWRIWGRRGAAVGNWLREQLKPAAWQSWLREPLAQFRQAMNQGTNLSIVVLLAVLPWVGLSGYIAWQEWTGEWVAELHEVLGNLALFAVLLHLAVLFGGSMLRRQNLVRPMLGGRLPGAGPDLVRNHLWLALLFSAAMVAFAGWYWQDAQQAQAADGGAVISATRTGAGHDDD